MRVPEERLYVRVEDTVVVTQDGIENLMRDAPLELDDVEALMREQGLLQAFPPFPLEPRGDPTPRALQTAMRSEGTASRGRHARRPQDAVSS